MSNDSPINIPSEKIVAPEVIPNKDFQDILEQVKSNSELHTLIVLLRQSIQTELSWPNKDNIKDFLKDPQIFQNNPSQYQKLFQLLDLKLDKNTWTTLKKVLPDIYNEYKEWSGNKKISDNINENKKYNEEQKEIVTLESVEKMSNEAILSGREERNNKWKRLGEVLLGPTHTLNQKIRIDLPLGEVGKMEKFCKENLDNQSIFVTDTIRNLPQEVKLIYLESYYYCKFENDIKKNISQQYISDPEKKSKALDLFDTNIKDLRRLNLVFPENSVSKAFEGNFAPTPATETARIQAEKLEKTHDVYREGTSLYFVNKSDPKDIRKIEIYADRAVLTVMQGGLSLSRDMTLLSHEETEERKEIRKAEGISGEKSRETETVWWVFFQMRGWEYATIPWGSRSTVDILRSRPSRSIQEQYESYEELLSTKSPEELRKESDSSRQSQWAIIERMLDLSRQLFADNQQYFAPWAFWEEKLLNEADQVKSKLDTRISWLKVYKSSIDTAAKVSNDLAKLQRAFNPGDKIDTSVWEGRARAYLKEAVSDNIWLDGFSDSQFQQLLYQLEQKDSSGWVWKGWIELGTDTVRRDHQLRELEDIARKIQVDGSMRTWWQWLGRKIDQEGTPENIAWKWNKEQFWNWYKSIMTPSEAR